MDFIDRRFIPFLVSFLPRAARGYGLDSAISISAMSIAFYAAISR
jgi:hypothetical protein